MTPPEIPSTQENTPDRSIDTLTGVLDRGGIDVTLREAQENYPGSFSILIIDINDLKPVNDKQGHAAGDMLIQTAASTIESSVRGSDSEDRTGDVLGAGRQHQTGRLGGDEFAVVLADVYESDIIDAIARRISKNLTNAGVSASIGSAPHNAEEPVSETMKRADEAMFRAKQQYKAEKLKNLNRREKFAHKIGSALLKYAGVDVNRV